MIENQFAVERAAADGVTVVHYERLKSSPDDEWPRLCRALNLANVPSEDARAKPSQQSATSQPVGPASGSGPPGWMRRLTSEQTRQIQGVLDEVGFKLYSMHDPAPRSGGGDPGSAHLAGKDRMNSSVAWQLAWALATVLVVYVLAIERPAHGGHWRIVGDDPVPDGRHALRDVQRADGLRTCRDPVAERRPQGSHVARAGSHRAGVPRQPVAGRPGADVVSRHLHVPVLLLPRRFPAGLQLLPAREVRAHGRRHSAGDQRAGAGILRAAADGRHLV